MSDNSAYIKLMAEKYPVIMKKWTNFVGGKDMTPLDNTELTMMIIGVTLGINELKKMVCESNPGKLEAELEAELEDVLSKMSGNSDISNN